MNTESDRQIIANRKAYIAGFQDGTRGEFSPKEPHEAYSKGFNSGLEAKSKAHREAQKVWPFDFEFDHNAGEKPSIPR